jgi:hypothetical protein
MTAHWFKDATHPASSPSLNHGRPWILSGNGNFLTPANAMTDPAVKAYIRIGDERHDVGDLQAAFVGDMTLQWW